MTPSLLSFYAGDFAADLPDSKLRHFHASLFHFFPTVDKTRVTAELKGLERATPRNPTTPFTWKILICFVVFVRAMVGWGPAVGMLVAAFAVKQKVRIFAGDRHFPLTY